MKKRIMLICEAMGGGVRRHILDILYDTSLTQKYDFFLVFGLNRADDKFKNSISELTESGITCIEVKHFVRNISIKHDLLAIKELREIVRTIKPDIIHCHSSKAGAIGRIVALFYNVDRVYYTPHKYAAQATNISTFKSKLYTILERVLTPFTTLTINVSYGEKEFAVDKKIILENESVVIYNGVAEPEAETVTRPYKNQGDIITIGCAARYSPDKDPYLFYSIAKEICSRHPNVRFIYLGDGDYGKKEITDKCYRANLQNRIKFLGFNEDVSKYLKEFDIYLSTSTNEGLPYSLIESLAFKLPIVATNVIGNNEIVQDGYNGYLFEAGNADQGIEKIRKLIESPELLVTFGENAYTLFVEKFRLEEMIDELDSLYAR